MKITDLNINFKAFEQRYLTQIRMIDITKNKDKLIFTNDKKMIVVSGRTVDSEGKKATFSNENCALNWAVCQMIDIPPMAEPTRPKTTRKRSKKAELIS